PQWFIPGTANSLTNSSARPLFTRFTSVHQFMVSLMENTGSLTPCTINSLPPRFVKAVRSVELAIMKSRADRVNSPDFAATFMASRSTSIPSRWATGSAPVLVMVVGGVENTADTAAAPSPAMIAEFVPESYAPIFQIRQPWLNASPILPPIPRSQAQSAYSISPFEFFGPANIFCSAVIWPVERHVTRFGPLQAIVFSFGLTTIEVHACKLSIMPSSKPSSPSQADDTA